MAVPLLQYIFLVVPQGVTLGSALGTHFSTVPQKEEVTSPPAYDVYVTHRHKHFPMLHVKTAKVEDADDLMPVFQHYTGDISQQYGEYFLAEMIESQDEDHRTLVAEVNGQAMGFVSVSTEVDVDLLNTCFQLEPFHGLRHSSESDEVLSVSTDATPPESLASSSIRSVPAEETADQQRENGKSTSSIHQRSAMSMQERSSVSIHRKSTVTIAEPSQARLEGQNEAPSQHQSLAAMTETKLAQSQSKLTQSQAAITCSVVIASTASLASAGEGKGIHVASRASVMEEKGQHVCSQASMVEGKGQQHLASRASMTEGEGQPGVATKEESGPSPPPSPTSDLSRTGAPTRRHHRKRHLLKGGCSAVAIQLFAIDERYEMRSIDFLTAIFQLFPDHDFCIITQPHNKPEFPLLSHFTRVNPRVGTTLPQELYVFHKCALLHSFAVRQVESSDIGAVKVLVSGLEGGVALLGDIQKYVEGRRDSLEDGATPLFAAVAECVGQVVGVAVLRQEENIGYIHSHYNIEDFVYFAYHRPEEHAHLHHLVLNPAFAPYTKHFIKELLRLSRTTCLYYPLYRSPSPEGLHPHTICPALGEMVPIRSRRQISYPLDALGVNAPLGHVLGGCEPFALYHTNRKLTLEPKISVNARVVVVGASDTSISLLESLVFSPHLRFNNLTLVSPHGMPRDEEDRAYHCLPHSCCYWPESHRLMGLKTWVNVVSGTMVAIQRSEQKVVVESSAGDQALVSYDYLVLCTGTQVQPPVGLASTEHVFTLRDEHEAANIMSWVENELIPDDGDLVVYGSSLEAYTTVQSLLQHGLPPSRLTLVQPRPLQALNNPMVEERVGSALGGLGLGGMYRGYTLEGWTEEGEGLLTVQFAAPGEGPLSLNCKGLIYLEGERCVDKLTFKAVNDACLVFDHRLVVDTDHRSNDPHIFAAGPLTKFSRRYRADQWTHANFNSKEVGQKLASTLLSQLDPTLDGNGCSTEGEGGGDLIPSYSQPKATTALLPGGLFYLHIEKPNQGERLAALMEHPDYGRELTTDTESGYFRVHVNHYGRVQTITVLSRKPLELTNYLSLYGLHESYLNNMVSRFDEKLIPDFFSYFREPWACAIFHDRFPDFVDEIMEHLQTPLDGETESFEEHVRKLVEDESTVSVDKHREQLVAHFNDSPLKTAVHRRLYHFLHFNSYHLPMYAKPDVI